MPLIQVTLIEGRSDMQLKAFSSRLIELAVEELGARPEHTSVIVHEVAADRWHVGEDIDQL